MLCAAALRADSLEAILSRMDGNAKQFKSVSAKLREASYNAVLQEGAVRTRDLGGSAATNEFADAIIGKL